MGNPYPANVESADGSVRLSGQVDFIDPGNQPGGVQVVKSAAVTLTNAQILDLVATPVEIVAAPGAGLMIMPVLTVLIADCTAGAYTNVQGFDPTVSISDGGLVLALDASNNFNVVSDTVEASPLLANARVSVATVLGGSNARVGGTGTPANTIIFDIPLTTQFGGWGNAALSLAVEANSLGAFGGGNAANTLRVAVTYVVVAAP